MLKTRLIVNLLWRNGNIVQSRQFRHTNVVGSLSMAIEHFNAWEADEIVLLNVSREPDFNEQFLNAIREVSSQCFVPLSAGGWITSVEQARQFLSDGADKLIVNTQAIKSPLFIAELANKFGTQCVVVSIDVRNDGDNWKVYVNRGADEFEEPLVNVVRVVEEYGAGELLITSIDCDGAQKGYDLGLIKTISEQVHIPVIAFGGVGKWEDLVDGVTKGKANAVAAGNIFHYLEQSTREAKKFMFQSGINVRKLRNEEFYAKES
jgi:imidazole glycerol-phosphate synthase subunit HisF